MKIINQPLESNPDTLTTLKDLLDKGTGDYLTIVVAWAKRSGLNILKESLEKYKSQGKKIKIVMGIDEGGATREGLEMAIEIFDECYLYNNPSRGTFHPKIYMFGGAEGAIILGSSNLTRGGLIFNYETNILLDANDAGYNNVKDNMEEYVSLLMSDQNCILKIDASNIQSVIDNASHGIKSEKYLKVVKSGKIKTAGSFFGKSTLKYHSPPRTNYSRKSNPAAPNPPKTSITSSFLSRSSSTTPNTSVVVRRWWKKMSASDALRVKNPKTKITGVVRLGKGKSTITPQTYFRNVFFGHLAWTPAPTPNTPLKEMTNVDAELIIHGVNLGVVRLPVSHDPDRESGQDNITTTLHWSPVSHILKSNNHEGDYLILEVDSFGNYVIKIESPNSSKPTTIV